ncbi:MAG: distal tail protein Dit [Anaerorhabdus sp.]|uniref:distal tail protein Dit n=1 Tax=Anaerorhabdus sp. TaxID=1872524 RepID=UPI003A838E00
MNYSFFIDDISIVNYGFCISKRPNIPAPERVYDEISIPGRNGSLLVDRKVYQNVQIEIEINYISNPNEWNDKFRKLKNILNNAAGKKLMFSDDQLYFYRIKKCIIGSNERIFKIGGMIRPMFVLEPFQYVKSGLDVLHNPSSLNNEFDESYPIYQIQGEGMCTLTVNGKSITANIGQNLTIDTNRRLSYRNDGTLMNTSLKGYYEDLCLQHGENKIEVSAGFSLDVIPNWRVI